MVEKNNISIDGNGNLVFQDSDGNNIIINDLGTIKEAFENTKPAYLKEIYLQISELKKISEQNKDFLEQLQGLVEDRLNPKPAEIEELRQIIAQNKIDKVFERLTFTTVDINALTLLKAQWNDLKQKKMLGLLSFDEEIRLINNIRFSILNLIKTLE